MYYFIGLQTKVCCRRRRAGNKVVKNVSSEIMDEYARYKYVVENIRDVIWEVDTRAVFTFISPSVKAMVGYTAEEMIGRCILDFLKEDSRDFLAAQLSRHDAGNMDRTLIYDVEFVCKDGSVIWSAVSVKPIYEGDKLICYVGTSREISERKLFEKELQEMLESQKKVNAQLEDMATYDMLTGAYNRRKFEIFVSMEIEKAAKFGSPFSICIFDVDNFKQINDTSGHGRGDRVLQGIGALVKRTLRETDKLFRWGGDEFIVLLPDIGRDNALKVASKLRETIEAHPFDDGGGRVTVSMGVGAYALGETPEQFVIRIDKALLRAKSGGKNTVEIG
jgi:diguanylate cyclase (GGDEF)-like protein/PAS domain S-box-containing protein